MAVIETLDLTIDTQRQAQHKKVRFSTGVYVRAKHPKTGKWYSVDIGDLDKDSLTRLLQSHGRRFSINTIGILLGHGHLLDAEKS